MLEPEYLASYIGIETPKAWLNRAAAAEAAYRDDWLEQLDFEAILDFYGFAETYRERFRRELELLRRDETLRQACWRMYDVLFFGDRIDYFSIWGWGKGLSIPAVAGHGTPVTAVVAQLAGQPLHARLMAERGYDEEQIECHKRAVRRCWEGERAKGIDGVRFAYMIWGANFMRGCIVSLGRLQYEMGIKRYPALEPIFGPDPQVAYIHIPGGGSLKSEDVDASLALAQRHICRYFPGTKLDKLIYYTHTWLLSPQLREILPESSNIMQFQKRFTLVETKPEISAFLNFGFKEIRRPGSFDYAELPEDTGLQRELKRRLIAGETLETGSGYFTFWER